MAWRFSILATLALTVASLTPQSAAAGNEAEIDLEVVIEPKKKGTIHCALYRDEKTWLTEARFRGAKATASAPIVTCRFPNVPPGTYGIGAFHDTNGDAKLDKNFLGIPQEGYAASRNAHLKGFGAPEWEDARFEHGAAATELRARMKY